MDYTEKTEKSQSPAVAIDGAAVRSIRETKKLTQLYVASVVGVTTDTISRWENNRYPSIKRENAEKLAKALEVAVDELLKAEDVLPEIPPEPHAALSTPQTDTPLTKRIWTGILIAAILTVGAMLLYRQQAQQVPTAYRQVPAHAAPGAIVPVKIVLRRHADDRRGIILKEQLPSGWSLVAALPTAMAQGQNQEIKWLIPGGVGDVQLRYTVQVAATDVLDRNATFSGTVICEGQRRAESGQVQGDRLIKVAGLHWADQNGDLRIDDAEIMPAYYLTEEFKGLGLNWQEIETIWNRSGYQWDRKAHQARPLP